jgi:hypothetical protein
MPPRCQEDGEEEEEEGQGQGQVLVERAFHVPARLVAAPLRL